MNTKIKKTYLFFILAIFMIAFFNLNYFIVSADDGDGSMNLDDGDGTMTLQEEDTMTLDGEGDSTMTLDGSDGIMSLYDDTMTIDDDDDDDDTMTIDDDGDDTITTDDDDTMTIGDDDDTMTIDDDGDDTMTIDDDDDTMTIDDDDDGTMTIDDDDDGTMIIDQVAPSIDSISVSPSFLNKDNRTLNIIVEFIEQGGLDTSSLPIVLITGLDDSYTASTISYSGTTWEGEVTIDDDDEEETAYISVTEVKDLAGNEMSHHSVTNFEVDTIAPNNPGIDPVTTPTTNSNQEISGTKESNTSVWINDERIISLNNNTTWSYNFRLVLGQNTISLKLEDDYSNESGVVTTYITREEDTNDDDDDDDDGGGDDGDDGGGGGGGSRRYYDRSAPSISNIEVVVNESENEATISWETDEYSYSWLVYGETDDYDKEIKRETYRKSHSLTLTNLSPNEVYHFQIKSMDDSNNIGESDDQTFSLSDINIEEVREKIEASGGTSIIFSEMMKNWESSVDANDADLNNDNYIDKYDFAILMLNWNKYE